jgi:P-type Cu2+ transporter
VIAVSKKRLGPTAPGGDPEDSGVRAIADVAPECLHCGSNCDLGEEFCCHGCASVYELLKGEGLSRYYELRGDTGLPATEVRGRDHKWLDVFVTGPRMTLDVQGIQCAACVWLFDQLFRRQPGAGTIIVNPTLGKMDLSVTPAFRLRDFVADVERFGYAVGPSLKADRAPSGDLITRIGVCIAVAMNAMIFSVAIYAGLHEGPIYRLFQALNFALATLSVLVGGAVFFRSAWHAVRRRILHLDVPIALGIALAYAGSTYAFIARGGSTYFDTLSVFIALMLVGRLLQERVVEKNRRMLLESDGATGLLTRRLDDGVVRVVPATEIEKGHELLVAPGDLVVVAGTLEDDAAACSLDWIDGESAPRPFARGDVVPAGAFNVGESAVLLSATTGWSDSPVASLLRGTRASDTARATPWWQSFARVYVLAVLALALAGFVGWWLATRDVERALVVTAGVLIVTCPCAFGIATPLAYELVNAGLRRSGLFVRSAGFLDRAKNVRRVVFDKTGTLTTGALEVSDAAPLEALSAEERALLYNLVARSGHPKSQAIARALGPRGARFERGAAVVERAGEGLSLAQGGHLYAVGAGPNGEVAFLVDGTVRALVPMRERLRPGAKREVSDLVRRGYDVWMLSGDDPANVDALADRIGLPLDRALGGRKPEDKLAFVREMDREDTLVIGDGLNDSLAVEKAFCSGTPAVDRPFLPARTDFYFTTPGLRPVGLALRAARALDRVTRRNLGVAVAYNVVTVGLAYAGLLSPLVCAIVMPVSSITVVLATTFSLSPRSALWKS